MSDAIDRLMKDTGARRMTRRDLLVTLSAVAMAPRVIAQGSPTPIKLRSLNSATMAVSDVQRSVAFYQKIFGMPVQTRQGQTALLRIGDGPQYLALTPANGGQTGIITTSTSTNSRGRSANSVSRTCGSTCEVPSLAVAARAPRKGRQNSSLSTPMVSKFNFRPRLTPVAAA